MEFAELSRGWRLAVGIAWLSQGLGLLQILVSDASWAVLMPGLFTLVVIALPFWLAELKQRANKSN